VSLRENAIDNGNRRVPESRPGTRQKIQSTADLLTRLNSSREKADEAYESNGRRKLVVFLVRHGQL